MTTGKVKFCKLCSSFVSICPGPEGGGGGGVLGLIFAGYVPQASHNPCPIIVYSVANYRVQLSHF